MKKNRMLLPAIVMAATMQVNVSYAANKPVAHYVTRFPDVKNYADPHRPGELYAHFPEGWEKGIEPLKAGYEGSSAEYATGKWLVKNMYPIKTGRIRIARHQGYTMMIKKGVEASLEMDFDLPYGASKFSFYYGAPVPESDTAPSALRVEYSQDSGATWTVLGPDLKVTDSYKFYFKEYTLNIKGPVRFRIHKLKGGARLSVDDVAVYQN